LILAAPAWATCDASAPSLTPTSRYVINGGTVYDKTTDLTWHRCSVGQRWSEGVGCVSVVQEVDWNEAMSPHSGGWRLPTKDELQTLVAPTCQNPAINEEAFPDMDLNNIFYWSSTEFDASSAWYVYFALGDSTSHNDHARTNSVRLVRSGQ